MRRAGLSNERAHMTGRIDDLGKRADERPFLPHAQLSKDFVIDEQNTTTTYTAICGNVVANDESDEVLYADPKGTSC